MIALVIHAIPLSLIDLPEPSSPVSRPALTLHIRERPVSTSAPAAQTWMEAPEVAEPPRVASPSQVTAPSQVADTAQDEYTPQAVTPQTAAPPQVEATTPPSTAESVEESAAGPLTAPAPPELPAAGTEAPATPLVEVATRRTPPPTYPESARREGRSGTVAIELILDERGRVRTAEIVETSGHDDLDDAALAAVRRWRFERGLDGRRARQLFEFRLENDYTP